ncbi:hypothetical protein [Actinomadura decatromicini]|uniref:hypothetical protein n=1 Tax=Actinomadura decatromicini TaxID=2604572 RepID=UPI00165306BA|nr:hypothetical protein [Actinomadura decatromicini]
MSANDTAEQPAAEATDERSPFEKWVERVGAYWGQSLVDAFRTVFPPREDNR